METRTWGGGGDFGGELLLLLRGTRKGFSEWKDRGRKKKRRRLQFRGGVEWGRVRRTSLSARHRRSSRGPRTQAPIASRHPPPLSLHHQRGGVVVRLSACLDARAPCHVADLSSSPPGYTCEEPHRPPQPCDLPLQLTCDPASGEEESNCNALL
jgi:hypothetical protein